MTLKIGYSGCHCSRGMTRGSKGSAWRIAWRAMLSCCKQTESGREGRSGDLRFAHAVGASCVVLPFAACFGKQELRW